jgi:hypothetical protein
MKHVLTKEITKRSKNYEDPVQLFSALAASRR